MAVVGERRPERAAAVRPARIQDSHALTRSFYSKMTGELQCPHFNAERDWIPGCKSSLVENRSVRRESTLGALKLVPGEISGLFSLDKKNPALSCAMGSQV